MDVVQNSLSIFVPPPVDNSIQKEYWIEFSPVAILSSGGAIEFNIPGNSLDYVNLSKTFKIYNNKRKWRSHSGYKRPYQW